MFTRPLAGLALAASLAVVVTSQGPAAGRQPDPKETKSPEPTKLPEPKWPTEIGGKDVKSWLKDLTDPDPAIRQAALNTIPNFGPDVKKMAGKPILARMKAPSAGGEPDPGVRITLYDTASLIGFDDPKDETEAIRLLGVSVDLGVPGGIGRKHAVQTLASIGPRAEGVVYLVAGTALNDPAFETRQSIARCLGQISMNKATGPNVKALQALAGTLAKDVSVAVRMEALQALVMLGPPWAGPKPANGPPVINQKSADFVAEAMRNRLGKGKSKDLEPDKQLEIWCRVVLMRFDPKEINDENLTAIARHCSAKDDGPKVQALQALAIFGEQAGGKVDAVVSVLDDDNPLVLSTALTALASMGAKAQGAVGELEKAEKKWEKLRQERLAENLKDKKFSEAYDKLSAKEKEQVVASMPQEQVRLTVANTIKWIKDSKPGMPGGEAAVPAPEKAP
ncbi:hypothetical protein : [Gemmataceae bacterium]|nr:hypothetical protein : [Gemmataceae bacterium]VTT99283.1 hypothetical protein : [Gemmataceae bacterium]